MSDDRAKRLEEIRAKRQEVDDKTVDPGEELKFMTWNFIEDIDFLLAEIRSLERKLEIAKEHIEVISTYESFMAGKDKNKVTAHITKYAKQCLEKLAAIEADE